MRLVVLVLLMVSFSSCGSDLGSLLQRLSLLERLNRNPIQDGGIVGGCYDRFLDGGEEEPEPQCVFVPEPTCTQDSDCAPGALCDLSACVSHCNPCLGAPCPDVCQIGVGICRIAQPSEPKCLIVRGCDSDNDCEVDEKCITGNRRCNPSLCSVCDADFGGSCTDDCRDGICAAE